MSVGLLYKVVMSCLDLSNLTVVSRKLILSLLYSDVNLIVGWREFSYCTNLFRLSSPCVQIRKMSSINLFQISGFSG